MSQDIVAKTYASHTATPKPSVVNMASLVLRIAPSTFVVHGMDFVGPLRYENCASI
jgi:hypothetical protein